MKRDISSPEPPLELSVYRSKTISILRRYFNKSVELGRLPSVLGRELMPSSHLQCHPASFEGFVVFVLDIERCLNRLRRPDQQLITRVILQEYTQEEAARLLGWPVIRIERRLPQVLDTLSDMLLRSGLMKPFPERTLVEPVDPDMASSGEESTVDDISAVDGSGTRDAISIQDADSEEDFRCVAVEIFLSSPPEVTIPAKCMMQ